MTRLSLNYLEAGAVAVIFFYIGIFLKSRIAWLRDFFIPAPVVGGLLFAFIKLVLYITGTVHIVFDNMLQNFFMTLFFTSIGFSAKLSFVRRGGVLLLRFAVLCAGCIIMQDVLGVLIASLLGYSPLLGIAAGSVPLVGGHGSAGVFGPILENLGVNGAIATSLAMATFGLIMGGLVGGPVAGWLINKHNLSGVSGSEQASSIHEPISDDCFDTTAEEFLRAMALLLIAMGLGAVVAGIGERMGYVLPPYLGSIVIAAIMRNVIGDERQAALYIPLPEIVTLAEVGLNIFLSLALMSLNMWELIDLAGPLLAIAMAQMLFMWLYTSGFVFRALGGTYEAAVIVSAMCGFGLGAVPTAMANMQTITNRFGQAPMAFLLVPIMGSMVDGINATIIIFFINLLK